MGKINNFESFDFGVSLWSREGIFLLFWKNLRQLLAYNMAALAVFISGYFVFCWMCYVLLTNFLPRGYFAATISFISATCLFLLMLQGGANYYFSRYRINYSACIRDFLLQLSLSLLIAAFFVNFNLAFSFGIFVGIGAFCVAFYDRVWSKKKLPDMKIVLDMEADKTETANGLIGVNSHDLKKIGMCNEIRNSFVLKSGSPVTYDIGEEEEVIVGIAAKEMSNKALRLTIKGVYSDLSQKILFSKEFNPVLYFRDRSWNDLRLSCMEQSAGLKIKSLIFTIDASSSDRSMHINLSKTNKDIREKRKKDIYLLVVDSLRHDYFQTEIVEKGCRCYNIPDFIRDSVVYRNAYTQGTWTLPALASILTGMHVSVHDVHHPTAQRPLDKKYPVLPEALQDKGYRTYAYVTGPRTSPNYGYARGFDKYYYALCNKERGIATADSAVNWIIRQHQNGAGDGGKFFYMHIVDTHTPYYPQREFEWFGNRISYTDVIRDIKKLKGSKQNLKFTAEQISLHKDLYRAEIWSALSQIDILLDFLKNRNLYDDSLIILCGDHGVSFNEHRPFNVVDLYDEYLHVGMAVKFPAGSGKKGVSEDLVRANIDLAPTILDVAGIERMPGISGESLAGGNHSGKDYLISEDIYVKKYFVSIRDRGHSFIYRTEFDGSYFRNFKRNNETFELYDLVSDPGEKTDIFKKADKTVRGRYIEILNDHIGASLKHHGLSGDLAITY